MQQQTDFLDLLYGKTFQGLSPAIAEPISEPSSRNFAKSRIRELLFLELRGGGGNLLGAYWETVTALPGVSMTLSIGEFPSAERESTLSQILDLNAPEKYSLSNTAKAGILRRAKRRGKELPDMLREALLEGLTEEELRSIDNQSIVDEDEDEADEDEYDDEDDGV